jgi:hypothetical protein
LRTSEPEKREALKNAVVHVAVNAVVGTPSSAISHVQIRSDLEIMFLHMIEGFTPTHLKVLRHCAHPIAEAVELFRRDRDLSDQAIIDFLNRGLIADTRPYAARGRDSIDALVVIQWDVTTLGRGFLEFIGPPKRVGDHRANGRISAVFRRQPKFLEGRFGPVSGLLTIHQRS